MEIIKNSKLVEALFSLKSNLDTVILEKNGQVCSCPFRTPQLVPGKIHGTAEMQIPACSNACQFFNIITHTHQPEAECDPVEAIEVYLSCNGGVSFLIQNSSSETLHL